MTNHKWNPVGSLWTKVHLVHAPLDVPPLAKAVQVLGSGMSKTCSLLSRREADV